MAVYVLSIHERGPFKIGHAVVLEQRIQQYQDHLPADTLLIHVLLPEAGPDVEKELHRYFDSKRAYKLLVPSGYRHTPTNQRHKRDWFKLSLEDLLRIESLFALESWVMVSEIAHWPPVEGWRKP